MKNTFLSARLVEPDLIRLVTFTSNSYEPFTANLVIDNGAEVPLRQVKINSTSNVIVSDYRLEAPLELGHSYMLSIYGYPLIPLDVSEATSFPDFDGAYTYNGDDLGATYGDEETTWVLWAPLASRVFLKVRRNSGGRWHYRKMARGNNGVYRLSLKGDYEKAQYLYIVTNSETTVEVIDPYAKGSAPNGEYSVVVDFRKLDEWLYDEALPRDLSPTDSIIYECSVRDMTIDKNSDIVHKGQYLGLTEQGRKTPKGNPAGLDYLKSLGITHLQILPFYDFSTIDERNPLSSYNWGYDPKQYFVPEGSFCSNVEDPYSRISETKKMISALHKAGIRIVMDAVYNHVYEHQSSLFEKVVPNYYFRRKGNGRMANTSYCGNDVASERPMVRKMIVDSAKWWIDCYGVNGFRFDLMGILDVKTLEEIESYGKKKDPSFLVYGEGWNMGGEVNVPLGTMDNSFLLPGYGFFNDVFREGGKKFLAMEQFPKDQIKFAYLGSSLPYGLFQPKFKDARQSVNYLECHDDMTYFDTISAQRPDLDEKKRLELCSLGVALVLISYGIPFIHMGQEIGQTKFGKRNSYNLGDHYNRFRYDLLDERKEMYSYCKSLISFRKKRRFLHLYDPRAIAPHVEIMDFGPGLHIHLDDENLLSPFREIDFFINVSDESMTYRHSSDRLLVLEHAGDVSSAHIKAQSVTVNRHSLLATALPMED